MHMQNYIKRKRKVDYFTCIASSILSSSKSCCTSGAQPSCEEVDGLEISTKESRCLCLRGTKSTPGGTSTVSTSRYSGTARQQCSHFSRSHTSYSRRLQVGMRRMLWQQSVLFEKLSGRRRVESDSREQQLFFCIILKMLLST